MAFGDGPDDAMLRAAWESFCDRLKAAGMQAFKDENPAAPLERADALRFLTQNLGQAFDLALETKDTRFPAIHQFCSPTRKLGSDCADYRYHQAWIDGDHVYRLHGHRGTARFFNVTVQGHRPPRMADGSKTLHEPFGDTPEANLFGQQLHTDADGRFEIFIGGEQRGPNWLPTTPQSRKLFIRQGFDAWDEKPATFAIERIDMAEPRPMPMPADMAAAMDWAGNFLSGVMEDWPEWPFTHGVGDPEAVNSFPPELNGGDDRKRGRAVANMHWSFGPDEAVIVEFPAHEGLWMLTNMGPFFNSMDFLYRPVSYTPSRTKVDADGQIRFILSHEDPGYHNWIDTQGFERGNLCYRHMLEETPVPPTARLVPRADLPRLLPGSAKVSSGERAALLRERHAAISRRYPT